MNKRDRLTLIGDCCNLYESLEGAHSSNRDENSFGAVGRQAPTSYSTSPAPREAGLVTLSSAQIIRLSKSKGR